MFLHDWAEDGLFAMIMDFEDVYISKSEYDASECPWRNNEMWLENKKKAKAALDDEKYQGIEVLLASYTYENYSGDAYVLFRKDGKLYEVNGGHCSCYGLEGQWEPEEVTIESIKHRLEKGSLGNCAYDGNHFADELKQIINSL